MLRPKTLAVAGLFIAVTAAVGLALALPKKVTPSPTAVVSAPPIQVSMSPASPASPAAPEYEPPRKTPEEVKPLWDQGKVVFFDVRGKNSYQEEHIKGAHSLPYAEVKLRYKELLRDKLVVLYCT